MTKHLLQQKTVSKHFFPSSLAVMAPLLIPSYVHMLVALVQARFGSELLGGEAAAEEEEKEESGQMRHCDVDDYIKI